MFLTGKWLTIRLVGLPLRAASPHARKDGFVMGDRAFWGAGVFPGTTSSSSSSSLTRCSGSTVLELPHSFLPPGKMGIGWPLHSCQSGLAVNVRGGPWGISRIYFYKGFTCLAKVKRNITRFHVPESNPKSIIADLQDEFETGLDAVPHFDSV